MNESSWDAHGVEIGACANFGIFYRSDKQIRPDKKMSDSMLWVRRIVNIARIRMVVARASGTLRASRLRHVADFMSWMSVAQIIAAAMI